jgi:hypothetical protein
MAVAPAYVHEFPQHARLNQFSSRKDGWMVTVVKAHPYQHMGTLRRLDERGKFRNPARCRLLNQDMLPG